MEQTDDKEKVAVPPVFDPKLYKAALALGCIYVQRGFTNYQDWSAKMTQRCSKKMECCLSSIWETLRNLTLGMKFDGDKITAVSGWIGSRIENGEISNLQDVINGLCKKIGSGNVENNISLINAAYRGVKKFFEDNTSTPTKKISQNEEQFMSKTNSQKPSRKKATEKKETAVVRETPSPLKITYQKDMGRVGLSENTAVLVSLIRNALEQKYVAIQKVSRTKDGEWKTKGGHIWLPFNEVEDIGKLIAHAYNEGTKAGWGNTYEPQPMNDYKENTPVKPTTTPALRELKLVSTDPYINQITLFDENEAETRKRDM